MAAGASDRLWDIGDIVALVEAAEAKPGKRGPYKARVAGLNPPQHVGRKPDRKQRLGLVVANPDRDVARRRVSFRQRVSEVYAFLPSLFGIRKVSSLFIAGPLAVVPANVKPKVGHGHRMPRPKPRPQLPKLQRRAISKDPTTERGPNLIDADVPARLRTRLEASCRSVSTAATSPAGAYRGKGQEPGL